MLRGLSKSAPVRKGKASALAVAKLIRRYASSASDFAERPPIIINSLPKSGTHLLLQVVLGLPSYSTYGGFIATTPSLTMRRRSDEALVRVVVPVSTTEEDAFQRALGVAQQAIPAVGRALPE